MPPALPSASRLNIAALGAAFDGAVASYKFLWTLALIRAIENRREGGDGRIALRQLVINMLRSAAQPANIFKLSFGAHDRMVGHLARMEKAAAENEPPLENFDEANSAKERALAAVCADLSKYVPQRWLSSFFKGELRGAGGATRNQRRIYEKIRRLADERFDGDNPPPYRWDGDGCILIHPRWLDYFAANAAIIKGWALWHWAGFLQARNPNIPGIIAKIARPESRFALDKQREFWGAIIGEMGGVACIYSGAALSAADFALDHYVPWSFVGHNQPWNLIPTSAEANSSKGDRLPSERLYFGKFVDLQHQALDIRRRRFASRWDKLIEAYTADLRLTVEELTDKTALTSAYRAQIRPLIALARANRFTPDWVYSRQSAADVLPLQ